MNVIFFINQLGKYPYFEEYQTLPVIEFSLRNISILLIIWYNGLEWSTLS